MTVYIKRNTSYLMNAIICTCGTFFSQPYHRQRDKSSAQRDVSNNRDASKLLDLDLFSYLEKPF